MAGDTDLFLALTPDVVLAAVEAAGLATNAVCYPLNAFENRVYEVELTDRSRVIAKFYRPRRWTAEQIEEEHRFLDELAAEEIPVATFRPFPGGGTLREIDGIFYALMDRRGGRAPDEVTDALAMRLGRLIARIHNVGARAESSSRLHLNADTLVRENLVWMEAHGTVPPSYAQAYFTAGWALADLYDRLAEPVALQRIHGDLHLGNLLEREGELRALDFDDMVVGPAVQDIWLALPGRDRETIRRRELVLEGYEEFRTFDWTTLKLIEPLRGLRIVSYSAWLAKRWHDPFFPQAFPHFGTESYWAREVQELEDVLAIARGLGGPTDDYGPAPGTVAEEEETPLTNKDYFWDWEE